LFLLFVVTLFNHQRIYCPCNNNPHAGFTGKCPNSVLMDGYLSNSLLVISPSVFATSLWSWEFHTSLAMDIWIGCGIHSIGLTAFNTWCRSLAWCEVLIDEWPSPGWPYINPLDACIPSLTQGQEPLWCCPNRFSHLKPPKKQQWLLLLLVMAWAW